MKNHKNVTYYRINYEISSWKVSNVSIRMKDHSSMISDRLQDISGKVSLL